MDEYKFETNEEVEFEWEGFYDTVVIENFSLTEEEFIKVFLFNREIDIVCWKGTVIRRNYYSSDETKEVNELAYGGFGNTNGIPEMGELMVDRKLLRDSKII